MSEKTTAELIEELEKTAWQGSPVLRILRRLDREKADKEQQSGEQPETPTMPEIEAGRAQFEKFLGPIPKPPSSPVPSPTAREIAENNSILAMQQLGAEGYTIDHPRSSPATIWEGVRKIITAAIELGQKQAVAEAERKGRMAGLKYALDTIRTRNFKETVDRLNNYRAELEKGGQS